MAHVPIERHELDNGLRIILSPDSRTPIVAVNLWYGVGSRNLRDKATALASTANFLRAHGWSGASASSNMGAIAGWNSASVYQRAIALVGSQIDGTR